MTKNSSRFVIFFGIFVVWLEQSQHVAGYMMEDGIIIEFDTFDEYKKIDAKTYAHRFEEMRSRQAFHENREAVREHNKRYKEGKTSFRMRMNNLADMTSSGYLKNFLRLLQSQRESDKEDSEFVGDWMFNNIPEALDWREKGFVTAPENQLKCGACYAFSVVGSIEGQLFKRTNTLLKLSVQQVVDCSVSFGNKGCTSGSLRNALKYLQSTGGIMRAKDYKYQGRQGKCKFYSELAVVNVTSWSLLPAGDENAMEAVVANIGPVAVSINARLQSFKLYSDGIYDDMACTAKTVNHAMLVVGYGKDYWILKNWWSHLWGEKGYMRIRKGINLCGIANYAAYAII